MTGRNFAGALTIVHKQASKQRRIPGWLIASARRSLYNCLIQRQTDAHDVIQLSALACSRKSSRTRLVIDCRLVRKYIERGKLAETATFEEAAEACKERSAWKDVPEAERPELYVEAIKEAIARLKEDAERKGRDRSRSRSKKRERSGSRGRSGGEKKQKSTEEGELEEGEAT